MKDLVFPFMLCLSKAEALGIAKASGRMCDIFCIGTYGDLYAWLVLFIIDDETVAFERDFSLLENGWEHVCSVGYL